MVLAWKFVCRISVNRTLLNSKLYLSTELDQILIFLHLLENLHQSKIASQILTHITKTCYIAIESRFTWDRVLQFSFPGQVLAELKFWNENIKILNSKKLMNYSKSSVLIYSDASNIGAAAYSVELENKVFHRMWVCFLVTHWISIDMHFWMHVENMDNAILWNFSFILPLCEL
jgi:hypothetical protein